MQNTILGYLLAAVFLSAGVAQAMTYVVDNANPVAADTNPGSKDAPLKTISAAAKKVQPGDEVVVRSGVYREAVTVAVSGEEDNPIVFRSEEPGKAVICGSDILSEWQPEGPGVWSAAVGKTNVVDHLGGNPQWIYFNGLPLERAETRDRLIPSTFYHDVPAARVYVAPREGDSLENATVEYACRDGLFHGKDETINDIHLIGFTLLHSADWFRGIPAVRVMGRRWLVENNHVLWSSYFGFQTRDSGDCVVRNNLIEWSGCQGIGGGRNLRLLVEGNTVRYNNWRLFNWGTEGGGSKWVSTIDCTLRDNEFCFNFGPGIWFDGFNEGNLVEKNRCHDNTVRSIFFEISWDDIVQDNIVYNTLENGILDSHSPGVVIRRNAIFNCGTGVALAGIYTRGNDHEGKDYPEFAKKARLVPGISPLRATQWEISFLKYFVAPEACLLNDCVVWDNLIFDNSIAMMENRDYHKPSHIDGFVNNFSDHNIFWAKNPKDLFTIGYDRAYEGLADWQKLSGRDLHSRFADPRNPATVLPDWAKERRKEWDLKMRPIREVTELNLGLVQSAMSQIALGRIFRSSFVKPVSLKDKRIKAFLFEEEGKRILGLWTTQVAENRYLRLNLGVPKITLENGYLKQSEVSLSHGAIDLQVTYNPIYLCGVGENISEVSAGVLTVPSFNLADRDIPASADFVNDSNVPAKLHVTFKTSLGFAPEPPEMTQQLAPGQTWEAKVILKPDGSMRKGSGIIRMESEIGGETIRRVAVFTVGEGENKLPSVAEPMTIDGKLDDWSGVIARAVPLAMIGDSSQLVTADKAAWTGPKDLSAKAYGAWTDKAIYVAIEVTDDKVNAAPAGADPRAFDSVDVCLDGRSPDMQWQSDLTQGCFEAIISPTVDGSAVVRPAWKAQGISGIEAASSITPTGYVLEIMIPLTSANFPSGQWTAGRPVKLAVQVNDVDGDASAKSLGWGSSPKGENAKDTSGWVTVILEK